MEDARVGSLQTESGYGFHRLKLFPAKIAVDWGLRSPLVQIGNDLAVDWENQR
jgi:hypothetical protein